MDVFLWCLLGLLAAGYFALAGYDYGAGLLLGRLGRDEPGRRRLLGTAGPFLLGNEVWLVAAAGLLFGAFPRLESKVFAGAYLVVVALLLGLFAFTSAVQLRSRRPSAGRAAWDRLLAAGAVVVSVCWGLFLGMLVRGLPATGTAPVLDPYLLPWGAGFVALFALHGAVFLTVRGDAPLAAAARRLALRLVPVVLAFVLTVAAWTALSPSIGATGILALPGLLVLAAALAALFAVHTGLRTGRSRLVLPSAMTLSALPVVLAGTIRFPQLVPGLSLAGAAASPPTLRVLIVVAVPAVLLVVIVQWLTWRAHRGRVTDRTLLHF